MVADGLCVKGVVVQARLEHLRSSYGPVTVEEVLGLLFESDQALLRGLLLPTLWYPIALVIRLDEAILATLGDKSRRPVFRGVGRTLAELTAGARGLLRRGDPHHVLRAAAELHALCYRYGERRYDPVDARSGLLTSSGPESLAVVDCITASGFLERMLELSGALDAVIEERGCRLQGLPRCAHHCRWKVAGLALTALAAS